MKPNNLDLGAIHPANGKKFSPNLFEFMKSHKQRAMVNFAQVYRDQEGTLWLGFMDEGYLTGTRLMTILCSGAKAETFSYGALGPLQEVESFWERYQKIGRCAVDPEHKVLFIGDKDRWNLHGDKRSCNWCGQAHQKLVARVKTVTHQHWETTEIGEQDGR